MSQRPISQKNSHYTIKRLHTNPGLRDGRWRFGGGCYLIKALNMPSNSASDKLFAVYDNCILMRQNVQILQICRESGFVQMFRVQLCNKKFWSHLNIFYFFSRYLYEQYRIDLWSCGKVGFSSSLWKYRNYLRSYGKLRHISRYM
jgi:hypothetical protein